MADLNKLIFALKKADFLNEQLISAENIRQRMIDNEIIISVIGQFKRGKSSIINAMLGDEILPVGIIPLTTAVTEIRYSEKIKAEVWFNDGTAVDIKPEQLEEYCSEQKNSGNHKNVLKVKIWTPNHPFGRGTVLVDTPGVGSVNKHNTVSANDYVERSDAVLFLLSVDSPVSEIERDFLIKAKEYAGKFFFAVNKCDTVLPDDLNTFTQFCSEVISENIGTDIKIKTVSAKTGQGIKELTDSLLQELKSSRENIISESADKKMDIIINQAKAKVNISIKAMSIPAQELSEKLSRIEEKQEELSGFSEEVAVLAKHRTDLLVRRIEEKINADVINVNSEITDESQKLYNEMKTMSSKEFENQYQDKMDEFLRNRLRFMNSQGIAMLEKGYDEIAGLLNDKAMSAALFISEILKSEFGLEYPVNETNFKVSERSDFVLNIGAQRTLLLNMDAFSRLLPKKTANMRFYKKAMEQALNDIERNKNNMIYNYRYKMQESLRTLCRELSESIANMSQELNELLKHIQSGLNDADSRCQAEQKKLYELLNELDNL